MLSLRSEQLKPSNLNTARVAKMAGLAAMTTGVLLAAPNIANAQTPPSPVATESANSNPSTSPTPELRQIDDSGMLPSESSSPELRTIDDSGLAASPSETPKPPTHPNSGSPIVPLVVTGAVLTAAGTILATKRR